MKDYKELTKKEVKNPFLKALTLILIFVISTATVIAVDVALKRFPDILKITHVYVRGVKVLSKDELFDGISINASLLKVNRDEIYNKLSRKKWVETVRITKIFPHTLVIDIEEKKPCIISEIKNKYYLLDKNGDIIDVYCPSLHIDTSKLIFIKQMFKNTDSKIYKSIYEQCNYMESRLGSINYVKLLSDHYMVVNMKCGIDVAFDPSHCNKRYVDNLKKIWSNLMKKRNDIYLVDARCEKVMVVKWRRHGKEGG